MSERLEGCTLTRLYVEMVADLFHYGHVEFLKKASAFGDHLLVGICSDEAVQANKRNPILSMEERICKDRLPRSPAEPWVPEYRDGGGISKLSPQMAALPAQRFGVAGQSHVVGTERDSAH